MQKQTKQKLTIKQKEILYFLYRFRFLNTNQLQQFLKHKNKSLIHKWINQLIDLGYIYRFYDSSTIQGKATAAVYCIATKARYILQNKEEYDKIQLGLIYKEKGRSLQFRHHCLLLADIYLRLLRQTEEINVRLHFSTKNDLLSYDNFPHPLPDAFIAFIKKGMKRQRYFIYLINPKIPWYAISAIVQKFVSYYQEEIWQTNIDELVPSVVFICYDSKNLLYVKKAIRKSLEDTDELDFPYYFTTKENILQFGLTNKSLQKLNIFEDFQHI